MLRRAIPLLALLCATALALTAHAPGAWLTLLTDGAAAVAVLLAGWGWGAWPARWLLGDAAVEKQAALGFALGLGLLGILALVLGCAGWMNQVVAWTLLALGAVVGLARLVNQPPTPAAHPPEPRRSLGGALGPSLALLPLAIPLTVALLAACLPPGLIWDGEGRGYDVLEYHLQAPREYFDAGRIHFLPHNVYASFPQQVEILYYLLMHLLNDPHAAAIPAQLLHLGLGVGFVLACAAWAPAGAARLLAVLVAGGAPWLAYVGPLAYVENGILLFAAVAGGLLLDVLRGAATRPAAAMLAAGLCAGLAGGCKYPALALVSAAAPTAWIFVAREPLAPRMRLALTFAVGVAVAFAPWALRNMVFTGNPVYPFAYSHLGGRDWSPAQNEQWTRGHQPPPQLQSAASRATVALHELFGRPTQRGWSWSYFGLTPLLAGIASVALRRDRSAAFLATWVVLMLVLWAGLTHLPGRFALPLLAPLALAAGLLGDCRRMGPAGSRYPTQGAARLALGMVAAACVGAGLQGLIPVGLLAERVGSHWRETRVPLLAMLGRTDIMLLVNPVNAATQPGAHVWLVGEARAYYILRPVRYTVVFSRDPWLEHAADASPTEAVAWLRTRGVSDVVFCWPEIGRLRQTYGFPGFVTPQWVEGLSPHGLSRAAPEETSPGYDVYRVDTQPVRGAGP
ncbi:MAG TPA: hypothetical protein PKC49_05065 [Phycisphaerae bacterium]|nr:hypothetical protein [Phycisphaerae bacterium]